MIDRERPQPQGKPWLYDGLKLPAEKTNVNKYYRITARRMCIMAIIVPKSALSSKGEECLAAVDFQKKISLYSCLSLFYVF
jgi:hypothetical protein